MLERTITKDLESSYLIDDRNIEDLEVKVSKVIREGYAN